MSLTVPVICAAVGSICAGAAAASFFILLCARLLRRSCGRHRLVSGCLLLSAAVVCAAVCIMALSQNAVFEQHSFSFIYYASLFLLGAVISSFYKIAFPLAVSVYIVYSLVCLLFLYTRFGPQEQLIRVTVSPEELTAGEVSYKMDSDSEYRYAVIDVYILKPELLLPLRSTWCSFAGFSDIRDSGNADLLVSDFICAGIERYYIEIPVADVVSALYTVMYSVSGQKLIYSLNRIL